MRITRQAAALAATWTLAVAATDCCAWGPSSWFGGDEAPPVQSAPNYGPSPAEPSWSQKLTAPLSPSWWSGSKSAPQQAAQAAQNDPIALGFQPGPPTADFYVSMAELSLRGGNSQHARQHYGKALSMEPKNVNALLGLARLEDRENQMQQAVAVYERAAKLYPRNTTVLNDYALCLARQNNLPQAYRLLRTAIDMEPRKELYRNNMAKVLIEMNRFDEAMANLNSVHAPAVAQYNMGVLLQQRGRYAESTRYLRAALAMEPRMEPARMLLYRADPSLRRQAELVAQSAAARSAKNSALTPQEAWTPPVAAPPTATVVDESILPTPEPVVAQDGATAAPYPTTQSADLELAPQVAMPPSENAAGDGPALLPAVR